MTLKSYIIILCSFFVLIGCKPKKEKKEIQQPTNKTLQINKANEIIDLAIKKHGGEQYLNQHFSFEFRDKTYSFINKESSYTYSVKYISDGNNIVDILKNGSFSRKINDKTITLNKKKASQYSAALNSVIYFALLPYKLNDTAVNKAYQGMVNIKNKDYHIIKVTFNQDGGGDDFDDIFYYWIGVKTHRVDYLAYKYHVNGGGIRFREAYNSRRVHGVLFQDYINYKANFNAELKDLTALYNTNKLVEVSRIELKNIK